MTIGISMIDHLKKAYTVNVIQNRNLSVILELYLGLTYFPLKNTDPFGKNPGTGTKS